MWSKWLMWDIGYQRMVERNSPYIELVERVHVDESDHANSTSRSATTASISLRLMGSDLVELGSTTPGFALTSSTVGGSGDELVVNIGGGGLQPGQIGAVQNQTRNRSVVCG